ncbi:phosphoenolpyruvate phosphomutase [Rhizobium sp. BK313]|uniref:isocitrate lyase/phosphoenolpyruvate mutase family protein n=1 Tax=Rhizobium sp. BK313 TaxID=2587081 RepID=UPI0010DAA183|nr:isocitrate lyase/phosphoenolpyruvate mutase family protein [Rhizobium sp. BK313]MBB3458804.1 phosphoenolpyruvate phosphomutase [Rhizobium sp. BK313]
MSPGKRLRLVIETHGLAQIMSGHSPLSAILADEAGFDGIWASGFELSALYGLPDMSFISMTQHLDMVGAIVAATTLPVVADIDTGFGNAINVMHAVKSYECAGAAAVVIEDKIFPKVSSLTPNGRQDLTRVEEFQGKIAAAVAARRDPDFLVIARTEALIAGFDEDEALARGVAYQAAGADMILVHSKLDTPRQIERFSGAWIGHVPLAIVPTTYPQLTERRIRDLGNIAMVIYGNHAIRACITAMRGAFATIKRDGSAANLDRELVSVDEVFRLQGMPHIRELEEKFLR